MRLLPALLLALTVPASAAGAPFLVDTTNHVIETSVLRLQFAPDCPERVTSVLYKPFSTSRAVNSEALPWEFTGQMIGGLWAIQGPIFSQSTDATDHRWSVIAQGPTRLVLRIESHSTYTGQPNPRVRTDYTFWADSSSYQVERTVYFSAQNWSAINLQPYVFRVWQDLSTALRWPSAAGVVQSAGFCGSGCTNSDWNGHWACVSGPGVSVTVMNHPASGAGIVLMADNDNNSSSNWTGPYTPSQAWTTDVTWRELVHFSPVQNDFALEDAIYAWWTQLPQTGVGAFAPPPALALSLAPNPAAGGTGVSYTLAAAGVVDVGVFDLAGRRVATLAAGGRAAGTYAARWDGNSPGGTRAAPGLYLVRVRTAAGEASRRLAWLE